MSYEERSALVEANVKLAYYWARKYLWSRLPVDDLDSVALEGLAKAATVFQPSYGYTFSTYATYWIRQYVSREIDRYRRHGFKQLRGARPRKVGPGRTNGKGREPPMPHEVVEDRTERPSARVERLEIWDKLMARLHPRYREVAELRFRENLSLEECGQILGITRERVRQLEVMMINKLRVFCRNMLVDATGCEVPLATTLMAN